MADEQKQPNNKASQSHSNAGDVHGRTHNSQNPELEQSSTSNDISSVDQQEGNMNNGEAGGNLGPAKE